MSESKPTLRRKYTWFTGGKSAICLLTHMPGSGTTKDENHPVFNNVEMFFYHYMEDGSCARLQQRFWFLS
jgi:hypothetical protein